MLKSHERQVIKYETQEKDAWQLHQGAFDRGVETSKQLKLRTKHEKAVIMVGSLLKILP